MEAEDALPFPVPHPRQLAESLMARAWDDDVADRERLLLEQAALAIQGLLVELAAVSEQAEARRSNVRR
jgi:hypothetical protein